MTSHPVPRSASPGGRASPYGFERRLTLSSGSASEMRRSHQYQEDIQVLIISCETSYSTACKDGEPGVHVDTSLTSLASTTPI